MKGSGSLLMDCWLAATDGPESLHHRSYRKTAHEKDTACTMELELPTPCLHITSSLGPSLPLNTKTQNGDKIDIKRCDIMMDIHHIPYISSGSSFMLKSHMY